MNTGDLAPNLTNLTSLLVSLLSTIDKGDTLTKVPTGLLSIIDVLKLD